jgi:hypothetical protein
LAKLGRKICCEFNKETKCILLVNGKKLCVFDETEHEQHDRGSFQLGVCPILPESEKEALMEAIKEEGYAVSKSWKK